MAPKMMNIGRQPYSSRMTPPASVPTSGPIANPPDSAILAVPRRASGARAISLLPLGNATPSPMPIASRITTSAVNPPAKPMHKVASAQTATPPAISFHTETRSASQPAKTSTGT